MLKNRIRRVLAWICLIAIISGSFAGYAEYIQAGTTIIEPLRYDASLECFVEKVTEYSSEYVEVVGRELTRKTVTEYYYLDANKAVYIDKRVVEDSYIDEAEPTAMPPVATTIPPVATSAPPKGEVIPQYTPGIITAEPLSTPVVLPTSEPPVEVMGMTAPELKVTRTSDKKATIKWNVVNNASGYIIYRSTKEYSGFKKVKTITSPVKTSYINKGLNKATVYYYKIKAYQQLSDKTIYTDLSESMQLVTVSGKKLQAKLKKLRKRFPDGMYWNHVGYSIKNGQSVAGYVTGRPCSHYASMRLNGSILNNINSTCNYYKYTLDGRTIMGYQCAGYACMLSEQLRGKTRFRSHGSFSKAKVGDCVRYSGHSAMITEKHSDYIVVTECNYGNTCIIKWGRKISRAKLSGARYYTK